MENNAPCFMREIITEQISRLQRGFVAVLNSGSTQGLVSVQGGPTVML